MATEDDNLKLWRLVENVDPQYVKPVTWDGRKFSTTDATYIKKMATLMWGPYGTKWGLRNIVVDQRGSVVRKHTDKDGAEVEERFPAELTMSADFFYPGGEFPIVDGIRCRQGGEDDKKLQTDCLKKALTYLGWYASIYLGTHDDDPYTEARDFYKREGGPRLTTEQLTAKAGAAVKAIREAKSPDDADRFLQAMIDRAFPPFWIARAKGAHSDRSSELQSQKELGDRFGGEAETESDSDTGIFCEQCKAMIGTNEYAAGYTIVSPDQPRYCLKCGGDPDFNGTARVKEAT